MCQDLHTDPQFTYMGTDLGDMPRPLDTTLITGPTVRWREPKVESFVNFILDKAKSSGPNWPTEQTLRVNTENQNYEQ
jgi:hypothetical protein